jgi:hypothetical protein
VLNLGNKSPLKAGSLFLSLVVCMSLLIATGGHGTAAVKSQAAAASPLQTVAKNPLGAARSSFEGTTAAGNQVTGKFTPLKFTRKNGNLRVRGLVQGVVHQAGPNSTFAVMRTLQVQRINGTSVGNARQAAEAAAVCRILRLRLGPINLNLLGLRITTNRIRLNIVAVPGPGNLLGNLLCAIAGLLDGPPTPAQLILARRQLNRLLGLLNLGL